MATKEFALAEVAEMKSRDNCALIIDGKVYNVSAFLDEHPGGEEVLTDLAGQDATEAFEDVGHSDEAREMLPGMQIGVMKPGEVPVAKKAAAKTSATSSGSSFSPFMFAALLLIALAAYQYLQMQK